MSWRDSLRPASFRGVPFKIESHELEGGRRGPLHEYPQRDDPFKEDTGRRGRRYSIACHVIGPDYHLDRDRLVDALERRGPGTLVHPYLGEREVGVDTFRLRESTDAGGLAIFDVVFVETGKNRQPIATASTGAAVRTAGASVSAALQGNLSRVFSAAGPGFIRAAATSLLEATADALLGASLGLGSGASLATFSRSVSSLRSAPSSLLSSGAALGAEVSSLLSQFGRLSDVPAQTLKAAEGLARFGADLVEPLGTTASRVQQASNQRSFVALVRGGAVVETARAASRMEFSSYQDAADTRSRVTELLDGEMERAGATGEDETFLALGELYARVTRDLTDRAASLATLTGYTPRATLPALVLAHRLYADAGRADEVVARNRIRHPGFVLGGSPLEVLAVG